MSGFALVTAGAVLATGPDAATLNAFGDGTVVALSPAAAAAAALGYALEVADGVPGEALAGAKARAWEAAKAARDAAEFGGCETAVGRIDTSRDSVVRINGWVTAAQLSTALGQPFEIDFTMADNSVEALDAQGMIGLGLAAMAHTVACHKRGRALRAEINAATSLAALAVIDIEAGWP